MTIYLACLHDRHTDDTYLVFYKEIDAKDQCKNWVAQKKWNIQRSDAHGDWCLRVNDDYYVFVQMLEVS